MMIGTNNSNSRSGPTDLKNSVNAMANAIDHTYGKHVWIAKPPHTYIKDTWELDNDRNGILTQYNQQINAITAYSGDDIKLGPNFFTQLDSSYYFCDHLHPNNTVCPFMANEWHKKLR